MATWWLSFADTGKPDRFLGVVIVSANDLSEAVKRTWELGVNPGGEITSAEMPTGMFHEEWYDRLLSEEEADALA